MSTSGDSGWCPFHAGADDLERIARDVAAIDAVQRTLIEKCSRLKQSDRVAHQYQVAGGKVCLDVAPVLPQALDGVGLFVPQARHLGVGRVSTGLGVPHPEPSLDFLGLRLAFCTAGGQRVDFIGINDPGAPVDNHVDFMSVLEATAESAGVELPAIGDVGEHGFGNLLATEGVFAAALARRMGALAALRVITHLLRQTGRTLRSKTAFQSYWTGVVVMSDCPGKFMFVPVAPDAVGVADGADRHRFSTDWRHRQRLGALVFDLYWIAYLDEESTPLKSLSRGWSEAHRQRVGSVEFPATDPDTEESRLWFDLSAEMGANPGNWVADRQGLRTGPSTEFEMARQIAYRLSQAGRDALAPDKYESVFSSGTISEALAAELRPRREAKARAGHVDRAT